MPAPDAKRVEQLEREIRELRAEVSGFIVQAKIDLRDLTSGVAGVNGHIEDLMLEVGDAPDHRFRKGDRETIRDRLHRLENDRDAAQIAHAALEAAQASKAQAWTRWQKIWLFIFAVIGAAIGVLRLLGIGG